MKPLKKLQREALRCLSAAEKLEAVADAETKPAVKSGARVAAIVLKAIRRRKAK
jgi:hypothetical protein